jgi:hypothetical protein
MVVVTEERVGGDSNNEGAETQARTATTPVPRYLLASIYFYSYALRCIFSALMTDVISDTF